MAKANGGKLDIGSLFKSMSDEIKLEEEIKKEDDFYVPSITEFCEDERYLGLNGKDGNPKLFPVQMLVLKAFYRGSLGNEDLQLTEEELKIIERYDLNDPENGSLIDKWNNGTLFFELVLVLGRRAGKGYTSSVIALYEICKLLEVPGGNPHSFYGVSEANPMTILTVATNEEQAYLCYFEIKDKLLKSPYFSDKIAPDGILNDQIWFFTPKDKRDYRNSIVEKKSFNKKGSLLIQVGNSNSAGLLGKGIFVAIFDEVASYKQTQGGSSGERIYSAVVPAVKTYTRKEYILDDDGEKIPEFYEDGSPRKNRFGDQEYKHNIFYDGKIISISSPRGKDGKLWELYNVSPSINSMLMLRLPTWVVNTNHTEKSLRDANEQLTEEDFVMEYGAEFSGTAGRNYFPRDNVVKAFEDNSTRMIPSGKPGHKYYIHLDPATTSNNYALCIVHKENFINSNKESDFKVILDFACYWHPEPGNPVKVSEVDDFVLNLKNKFNISLVTYDNWNSDQSIEKLTKAGIPNKRTHFSSKYKMRIYGELYNLLLMDKIKLPNNSITLPGIRTQKVPPHILLRDEMLTIQRKETNFGFKVYKKKDGECKTDDLIDALSGAVYSCLKVESTKLPSGKLISNKNMVSMGSDVGIAKEFINSRNAFNRFR